MAVNEVMEHEFDADDVNSIDQDSVAPSGPTFPSIQWHYGDPKMKKAGDMDYLGGFFVKSDQVDGAAMEGNGWKKLTWTHGVATEEEGWWKREIEISVIGQRHRWEVANDDGPRRVFAWNKYKEACAKAEADNVGLPSSRLHVLVLVKGLEKLGPFVLTMKGSAALAFEGNRSTPGALPKFAQTVIRAANAKSKASTQAANEKGEAEAKAKGVPYTPRKEKMWAYRAFWLPIGAKRDKDGAPVYIEVGKKDKKHICPPEALGLPEKVEDVNLNKFYVGGDMLNHLNQLYADNAEWITAWDNLIPGSTDNSTTVAAAEDAPGAVADTVLAESGL
jgi:hypothetical protein